MYSIDQDIPSGVWQLIIRARTESELDRAIIIVGGRIAATVSSHRLANELAPVAARAVARVVRTAEGAPAASSSISTDRVVGVLQLIADYEDRCPTPYLVPWRRPHGPGVHIVDPEGLGPDPLPWDESFNAVALATVTGLAALTEQGKELAQLSGQLLGRLAD